MLYKKVSTKLDFVDREKEVLKYWKENDIFEKSIDSREGCEVFTFYDGPPTANGKPHIGHVLTRAVKDLVPRYKTMKGYKVLRKAGWDTHGLPVELEVEKSLGISGKPQIENYGVESFVKKCKESVWTYKTEWEEMSDRVGFWADMKEPYVTYDNSYIESEWWAIKQIAEKDLLYKGHKIVPYCPRCGTSLSSHEVAQGYKDVKESSAYVKFKLEGKVNEFFLAWTTTPWTLPSNIALVVNPNEEYVKVKEGEEYYILAKALVDTVLKKDYEIVETYKGIDLEHIKYEPLFDFCKTDGNGYFICCDDYVTLTDGTGIVHTAPAFGEDDARVGRKYDLAFLQYVDGEGKFTEEVEPWVNIFVKDADKKILVYMNECGSLYKEMDYEHSYPFCWRCDSPLLYYARNTWFIKMTAMKDNLIKNNNTINWLPDNIKTGRFGNFLENVIDWGISRERYWGTPLPIWTCECGHMHVVGSIQELREMSGISGDIELHKPYIDNVHLKCTKCNGSMNRVPEVIDCWFDSGSMPFAQWHYPFENKEIFEQNFPANFISEAVDQTRGWFYTLLAISTLLFDKAPFENCIVLGHVQDKDGVKMSKHKGNVTNPWDILDKQGADAVRFYFYSNSAPWLPNRFSEEAVNEVQRKFMGTLWNTYAFFVLYANIDEFNPQDYELDPEKLNVMDKWVLSKLNTLVKYVDECLENYKITESTRAMNDFVDELSNWYVRRSRERFWGKDMPQDKVNAYMTLYSVLETLAKISAPFVPFMAEEIYQNLVKSVNFDAPESVHLCDFPVCNDALIDKALENNMDTILKIVVLGRSARNNSNIKNRQPIALMYVKSDTEVSLDLDVSIIAEELNVKSVQFTGDVRSFTTYMFKPQLRTVGKKYGKLVPKISQYLKEQDGNELMNIVSNGEIKFSIDGEEIVLSKDDVLIEPAQKEGYMAESDRGITVVIKTELSEELIEEGFVRELISKLQTMRKDAEFEILDRIRVFHKDSDVIAGIIQRNLAEIKDEVLADEVLVGSGGYAKEWSINGESVTLGVEKVY